jgi:O-antigen/teichoic acid export membrane protein
MVLMLFVVAFSNAWTPFFNSFINSQERASEVFGYVFTYYIMLMGLLCLGVFLYAKVIVTIIASTDFYSSYSIVGLVSVSQLLYGCYLIFLPGLYYAKKTSKVNFMIFISCFCNIVLNYILIPKWNMLGAAIATIISFIFMATMTNLSAKKYFEVKYDWMRILKYGVSWGIAVGFGALINTKGILETSVKAFCIIALFIAANWLFLGESEKRFIRKGKGTLLARLNPY